MSIIASVGSFLLNWLNFIPKFVYFILVCIISVLDVFQFSLRKMAGLDVYYIGDSDVAQTGDIALGFIRSIFSSNSDFPALQNAFWALMILGILLLVVTTIIAIIRQEYMPGSEEIKMKEKPTNNKMYVITRSVKSLFMFLIVPTSVIFGLMFSDILLQALDRATTATEVSSVLFQNSQVTSKLLSADVNGKTTYLFYDIYGGALPSTTTSFSGQMFKSSAFSASRIRKGEKYDGKTFYNLVASGELSNFEIFNLAQSEEEMALMVDDAFANNVHLASSVDNSIIIGPTSDLHGKGLFNVKDGAKIQSFSKFNVGLVWYFYDLWLFNYLIGFAFLVVSAQLLINASIGLAKRIIEMVALFIISPPIIATMPLDEGKAFQKWRQNFLSKAISAFGVIVGLNLVFLILPYIQLIKLFPETNVAYTFVNLLFSTLYVVLGLTMIESMIAMLSKMIGAEDAAKAGSGLVAEVGATIKKAAMMTGGAAGFALKAMDAATGKVTSKTANSIGQGIANRAKSAGNGIMDKVAGIGLGKKSEAEAEKAKNDWERGAADEKYDKKMKADEDYQKEIDNDYSTYQKNGGAKSKEEWAETAKGKESYKKAESNYAGRIKQTREEHKNSAKEKESYVSNRVEQFKAQELSNRKAHIAKSIVESTGLNNTATLGELFTEEMKDAFVRGNGKGGFIAMNNAFKGKSSYDAEMASVKKKLEKEEKMRARTQIEQQQALEKKDKK